MATLQLEPIEVVCRFPEIDSAVVVKPRIDAASEVLWINALPRQSEVYVRTMIGFGLNAIYLVRSATPYADGWPQEWLSWRCNQNVFQVACDPSDASVELIRQHLPVWLDLDLAQNMLQEQKSTKLNDLPLGPLGRYSVGENLTTNQRDALWLAQTNMFPLDEIGFVPDVTLRYNNKQSRFTGRPVSIWSDGAIRQECWRADGQIALSKDVERLLAIALYQKSWRETGRWQELLTIGSVQREPLASERSGGRGLATSWSAEKSLQRLTADTGLVLFLAIEEGGALGVEGDTWDHAWLFEHEADAWRKYNEIDISYG